MSKEVLDKIAGKAKNLKFFAERSNNTSSSLVVKQMEICSSPSYPDFMFVVCENMIFVGNELSDSSYTIYSFDMLGNYVEVVDVKDLPATFIGDRTTIQVI